MGLLTLGTPLEWSEIKQYVDLVHQKGIKQFINLYKSFKDQKNDCLKWGDEVEFCLIKLDHDNKKAYLLLNAEKLLPILQLPEINEDENVKALWRPEYSNYMVEGTPGKPYDHQISNFNLLEENMRLRRQQVLDLLDKKNEYCSSLTAFPSLGCENFTFPSYPPTPDIGVTRSLFYPDQVIYPGHPRFASLSKNIRERRGSKVAINIPIYFDKNTPKPFIEQLPLSNEESRRAQKENHIYLDAMGFGMGCSCLQMTFQAQSIDEARHLYDQLTPLTPIMLALSAAAPIWRGYLSDVDCRWNVISASVDDRTPEERGEKPLKNNKHRINKSRYDSIDSYLSPEGAKYNDIELVINEEAYKTLVENDIDHLLAQHIAHLFIREPVSLFKEKLYIDDTETDHFENIQSTNWQTMRFKPPPTNAPIGWRVEFRPTELQITDFENAAFVTFLVLFTRVILSFKLNLLIPISKVDENMQTAQKRDACRSEKFYFRKSIFTSADSVSKCPSVCKNQKVMDCCCSSNVATCLENEYTLMTINDIVNGNDEFPGIISLIKDYLNNIDVDVSTQCTIKQYLRLIEGRANGELMTTASYMRKFVNEHPKYDHDSRVGNEITYDLLNHINKIANGEVECRELFYDSKF
jgi:glutamate--cysteine ligase catalytic subunit